MSYTRVATVKLALAALPIPFTSGESKKLAKYMEAGVREYWSVNPYQKNVLVYHFPSEVYPVIYSMDVDIPVGIYEGELVINLSNLIGVIDKFLKSKHDKK